MHTRAHSYDPIFVVRWNPNHIAPTIRRRTVWLRHRMGDHAVAIAAHDAWRSAQ